MLQGTSGVGPGLAFRRYLVPRLVSISSVVFFFFFLCFVFVFARLAVVVSFIRFFKIALGVDSSPGCGGFVFVFSWASVSY